jgi:hypothetical protein
MLPSSLDIEALLNRPAPRDMTLGELRAYVMTLPEIKRIGATHVRFVDRREELEDGECELPDDTTLAAFQRLVKAGTAIISIDDDSGGWPAYA